MWFSHCIKSFGEATIRIETLVNWQKWKLLLLPTKLFVHFLFYILCLVNEWQIKWLTVPRYLWDKIFQNKFRCEPPVSSDETRSFRFFRISHTALLFNNKGRRLQFNVRDFHGFSIVRRGKIRAQPAYLNIGGFVPQPGGSEKRKGRNHFHALVIEKSFGLSMG